MVTTQPDPNLNSDADEAHIFHKFQQKVAPFWQQEVKQGKLRSEDNVDIAYAYVLHPQPLGSIAISSGRIETLLKYKELLFDLYSAGYSVFIHDHRGQGLSSRMTTNAHQGYVESFDQYISDFKLFYDEIIAPNSASTPALISHSMGGAIACLYLLKYPKDFSKCVMSAPMFGILPALPYLISVGLTGVLLGLNKVSGRLPWYFLGQGDYLDKPYKDNDLTTSAARYAIFRDEYNTHTECQLGGVTTKWLSAAYQAMRKIEKNAKLINHPLLLLQAGSDQIVNNRSQDRLAQQLPNCQLLSFANAEHELLMEVDAIRDQCLAEALLFISK